MPWSDGLVPGSAAYQIASSTNPRVRVVAGPGTGKSFAMKRRVARFLETGTPASEILPVTFTRVAAEDLHRELIGMSVPGCDELRGTTLHSLALRILMRNHVLAATGRHPRPLNDFEVKPMEADLAGQHGGVRAFRRKLKAYEAAWARLQHDQPGYAPTQDDLTFESDLLGWLIFHKAMLIGEVIPRLHGYLRANPGAPERSEYQEILVDEYQDLNKAEQQTIEFLSNTAGVCIVGDDDQSIYSFKHAHPDGIRDWIIVNAQAADLSLTDCRRCPTHVVTMANSLIRVNVNRPVPRPLNPIQANGVGDVRIIQYQTLSAEITGIGNLVAGLIASGTHPGDILILAQRGAIGTPIYENLVAINIPTKSYYAEAELDDEAAQANFALLKLVVDREDRAALRWLIGRDGSNWHAAGYARIRNHCELTGDTPWQALEKLESGVLSIPYTSSITSAFVNIKTELDNIELAINTNGLQGSIDYLFPAGNQSVRDLRRLAIQTLETAGEDREEFIKELTHAIAQPEIPTEIQEVRIMSLHKSKGLSAHVTIIAGCVEGLLPKQPDSDLPQVEQAAQIEEQRRLFYVGMTRVKAVPADNVIGTLILTYARQMPLRAAMSAGIAPASSSYGNARLNASRFIGELGSSAPAPISG